MNDKTKKGVALAAAAAGLILFGSRANAMEKAAKTDEACKDLVQCWGVNVCKGHGDCATATNSCHDQVSCKGQGWVKIARSACEDIGGEAKPVDFNPKKAK